MFSLKSFFFHTKSKAHQVNAIMKKNSVLFSILIKSLYHNTKSMYIAFLKTLSCTSPILESTSSNSFFCTPWLCASTWLKKARTVLVVSYPASRKVMLWATISLSLKAWLPSFTLENSICCTKSNVLAFACKRNK